MKRFIVLLALISGASAFAADESSNQKSTSSTTSPDGSVETTTTETRDTSTDRGRLSPGGLYVEPMLIFGQNDTTIKTSQLPLISDDTSGSVRDAAIGARFGFHLAEIFTLAADGRYGKSRFQDSFYGGADSTSYNYGVTAGVQTPVLGVRIWGTYILGGQFDPERGVENVDLKFTEARGYRVGAGIHAFAVSLNLEYQDLTYNKSEVESVGNLMVGNVTGVDVGQRGYALSVGFPIEL